MNDQQLQFDDRESQSKTSDDVFGELRRRIAEMRSGSVQEVNPESIAEKLAKRAKTLRGRIGKGEPTGPLLSFLAFSHGRQRYGIPIAEIIEVQPFTNYTLVPQTPPFIMGVIHWRGAILALLDLVKLFHVPESGLIDERAYIIVEAAGKRVGFLAGEVEELRTLPLQQMKSIPDLSDDVFPEWVVGVYDENRLILNVDMILQDERVAHWRSEL